MKNNQMLYYSMSFRQKEWSEIPYVEIGKMITRKEMIREREAEVIQRVTNKMKEIETYNYQARQRTLKEY